MAATRVTRRLPGVLALVVGGWACRNFVAPLTEASWRAELNQTQQLLTMEFHQSGGHLSGSAALARLTEAGAETLTLSGSVQADTLDIIYSRSGVPSFRFLGWYVNNRSRITGTLDGAEFTDLAVQFRKQ